MRPKWQKYLNKARDNFFMKFKKYYLENFGRVTKTL